MTWFLLQIIRFSNSLRLKLSLHFKKISAGRPGPDSIYEDHTKITYELKWQRNQAAIDRQALADGTFPLITNTSQECAEVLRIYKQQPRLEKRFSTTKSVLEIAPVFLEKSSRLEAITFLYFVALMVIRLICDLHEKGNLIDNEYLFFIYGFRGINDG